MGATGALGTHPHGLVDEAAALARAEALGRELVAAIAERRAYPEQQPARDELFGRMKWLVTAWGEAYPAQYEHWRERGWL